MLTIINGDALTELRKLADESVQCCVTSPPYWALRDYGVPGQLGLEPTPAEYVSKMVAVFNEVRRVLKDDGTIWINFGDTFASQGGRFEPSEWDNKQSTNRGSSQKSRRPPSTLKPKDLIGIPWMVAKALRDPHYTGTIKDIQDRIWLAAMIDAEGCMFIHRRKAGQNNGQGYERQNDSFGPGLEVANTSEAIVQRCLSIVGKGSICSQSPSQNNRRKQTIYRWNLRLVECRDIVREIYPHLVAKQHQARILCGCPSSGPEAKAAHQSLIALHNGGTATIDFPEPKSMFEPGFYLRSDIIWNKANPMPESVTDRPTKAHEYIFLMSKSQRYFYDGLSIQEPSVTGDERRPYTSAGAWELDGRPAEQRHVGKPRNGANMLRGQGAERNSANGPANRDDRNMAEVGVGISRNKRSVWTVATAPYPEAHFATFPPDLIKPCILAGTKPGDVVLDPFAGSGTTGQVALELGRKALLIELNPEYCKLIERRCSTTPGHAL